MPIKAKLFLLAVFIGLACVVATLYESHQKQVKVDTAVSRAPALIKEDFLKWSGISSVDGEALQWIGADSEILYVQRDYSGLNFESMSFRNWLVWAKTPAGRIYKVHYWIDGDATLHSKSQPMPGSQASLVDVLVKEGQVDLIRKLGLPLKAG